jgi:hypothetical protein
MWNLISLVFLTVIIVYVVNKISDTHNLLSGVSDDIYDIKKKLGLVTYLRTKHQEQDRALKCIEDAIYDGKDIEELKKTYGASEFRKYKWWIDSRLQSYSKMKICPKCDILYTLPAQKECKVCKIQLVSTKEHKPSQSTIFARELDRIEDELGSEK